jgi:3'(2'), 5'-bisphosphate nucleotidase
VPIVSEENAAVPFAVRQGYQYSWCVDPLDGTKARSLRLRPRWRLRLFSAHIRRAQEFIKRNGQFTVNIALLRGGVPVLGVVHTPVTVCSMRLRLHLRLRC